MTPHVAICVPSYMARPRQNPLSPSDRPDPTLQPTNLLDRFRDATVTLFRCLVRIWKKIEDMPHHLGLGGINCVFAYVYVFAKKKKKKTISAYVYVGVSLHMRKRISHFYMCMSMYTHMYASAFTALPRR